MSVAHRSLYLVYGGLYALGGYVTWWVVRSQRPLWVAFGECGYSLCPPWYAQLLEHASAGSTRLRNVSAPRWFRAAHRSYRAYRLGISSYRMKVIAIDGHHIAHIGPLMVTDAHWLVFGSTFALFIAVQGFLTTSRLGRALRAFVDEPYTAMHGGTRQYPCGCGPADWERLW